MDSLSEEIEKMQPEIQQGCEEDPEELDEEMREAIQEATKEILQAYNDGIAASQKAFDEMRQEIQTLSDMIAEQGAVIEEVRWALEYTLAVQSALGMNENSDECAVISNASIEEASP